MPTNQSRTKHVISAFTSFSGSGGKQSDSCDVAASPCFVEGSSVVRIIPVFRGDPAVCGLIDLQFVCWSPCIGVKLKGRISGS